MLSRVLRNVLVTQIMETILGLIKLRSHKDPILEEHVLKVGESQKNGDRL